MPVTSGGESIKSVFLPTSALFSSRPLSFLAPFCMLPFHLFWKIHIERYISITYILLPGIQLNFVKTGVQNAIEQINGKYVCCCPSGVSSFLWDTWVGILLGNTETIGQTGAFAGRIRMCNSSGIFRLQNGSADIHRIFLFGSILGPASCLLLKKCLATLQLLKASFQLCDTPISC